jgi:hypothetical protein
MSVQADQDEAVRFLEWRFGQDPSPYFIGISYQRDLDNADLDDSPEDDYTAKKQKPKREASNRLYTAPFRLIKSQRWKDLSDVSHTYFCTTPLLSSKDGLRTENTLGVPDLWVDIDSLRELDIDGDEFYAELRDSEPASCWTRSSKQGIQGFFRLKSFFKLTVQGQTQKEVFKDDLKPLLLNIAYYFGGDPKVVSPARLMRLPGTLNPKRGNYLCRAIYYDHVFAMAELRKRFKEDITLVPKTVFYAIAKAMSKHYGPGNHHEPSMHLFGTCRTLGLDEDSCMRLAEDLGRFFKDMADDQKPSVSSTYLRDMENEGVATLRNDYEDIAEDVEKAVSFWIKLKIKYSKAIGIPWKPDSQNPLVAGHHDDTFQTRSDGTWFLNDKGVLEQFSNFSLSIPSKIVKSDGREVDIAALTYHNRRYEFEWPSEKDTNFTKFKTIPGLPPKLVVFQEVMWKPYIAWLADQQVENFLRESTYYGMLDVAKGKPTLLIPKRGHSDYIWQESPHDTASHDHAFKTYTKKQREKYLKTFGDYYKLYHAPEFLWPALGWFAACPFAAFAREMFKGFPTLLVSGLAESGKTSLIKYVLANAMGCEDPQSYLTTTLLAKRKALSANNIIPLVIDEFRDTDEKKTDQLLDLVRNLWDQAKRKAGAPDQSMVVDHLVGSLCLIGEHQYTDEATLHRTFSIRVTRDFIQSIFHMEKEEKDALLEAKAWLESTERKGMLGSILIQWLEANMDKVPAMLEKAKRIIDKRQTTQRLRNAIGMAIVLFGILVLEQVYAEHGLEFPITREDVLASMFTADESINNEAVYGATNLSIIMHATDAMITTAAMKRAGGEGYIYWLDPEDESLIYFDISRWQQQLIPFAKGHAIITNRKAFDDFLHVSMEQENSPILNIPCKFDFAKHVVAVSMKRVSKLCRINVTQWRLRNDVD